MATSNLRTHHGKSIRNNEGGRSKIMGLLQCVPTADQFQCLSHSLLSVPLDGGQSPFVVDNCLKLNTQPPSLSRTAAPEFMISNNETENQPPDARQRPRPSGRGLQVLSAHDRLVDISPPASGIPTLARYFTAILRLPLRSALSSKPHFRHLKRD